jgi:hypothetical protein
VRSLAPRLLALDDLILSVLRDAQGVPLSTALVARRAGPAAQPADMVCGARLRALLARGEVERLTLEGFRAAYWRRTAP